MAAKVQVPKFQRPREYTTVEAGATLGATIGENVFGSDGKIWVPPAASAPTSPTNTVTYWRNLREVPVNVQAIARIDDAGIYVVTDPVAGTSTVREIVPVAGQLTVSNGDGVSGNPTVGLADVANVAGGAIQLTAFDAKGRRTSANPATTDNLTEGATNLYFSQPRVRSTTLLGLTTGTGGAITSTDTILQAFGKLQNQVTGLPTSILAANNAWTGTNTWSNASTWTGAVTGVVQQDGVADNSGTEQWIRIASIIPSVSANCNMAFELVSGSIGARREVFDYVSISARGLTTVTAIDQSIADGMIAHMRVGMTDSLNTPAQIGVTIGSVDGLGNATSFDFWIRRGTFGHGFRVIARNIAGGTYYGRQLTGGNIVTAAPSGIFYGTVRQVYSSGNPLALTATTFTMATSRLIGRTTAGSGAVEELAIGTGLTLATGVLGLSANLQAWSALAQPPSDSKTYGLNNGVWTQAISDAPSDGSIYGRKDGVWTVVTGGGGGGGTVTSVSGSGGTTGLTLSGGPITGSGTLTLGGTLAIANGGTGATTAAAARTALAVVPTGAITTSGLTMATARILGRTTASAGAVEEIAIGTGLTFASGTLTGTGGTVTSVAMSVPTGFSVAGTPITSTGTFAVTYAAGYQGYTTTEAAKLASIATVPGNTTTFLRGDGTWSNTLTGQIVAATSITLTGTNGRILSDFTTGATASPGRTYFQTSTTNGSTNVGVLPNGTGGQGLLSAFGGSDPANSRYIQLLAQNAGSVQLISGATGTAVANPNIDMVIGGSVVGTFSTTGLAVPVTVQGGTIVSGQNFVSASTACVVSTTGTGVVYLRPNGAGSSSGQFLVNNNGDIQAQGLLYANDGVVSTTAALRLSTTGAGAIYLRPNGVASTTGQTTIDSAGNLAAAGTVFSSQSFVSNSGNLILATTGAAGVYVRPNGAGSSTGQLFVNNNGDISVGGALYISASGYGYMIGDAPGGYLRWSHTQRINIAGGNGNPGLPCYSAALQVGGSYGGGISMVDGGVEYRQYVSGGTTWYFGVASTGGAISSNWAYLQSGGWTAVAFTSTSDARLKTDIRPFDARPLGRALQLCDYQWSGGPSVGKRGVSPLAQAVQKFAPQYVQAANDEMGTLSIDKGGLALETAVHAQIQADQQEQRIRQLEAQVQALLARAA